MQSRGVAPRIIPLEETSTEPVAGTSTTILDNPDISGPNYHSGVPNGDYQEIPCCRCTHALLSDPTSRTGDHYLPRHPHEGGVRGAPEDPTARVIATGAAQ